MKEETGGLQRREFFRLSDVFPVTFKKCPPGWRMHVRSRCLFGLSIPSLDEAKWKDKLEMDIWRVLVDLDRKLNFILEKILVEKEGIDEHAARSVTLSEAGLGVILDTAFEVGDLLEIKMLLPSSPTVGILTYGEVKWVREQKDHSYETGVSFLGDDATVTDAVRRYILRRQRERNAWDEA